MCTYMYMHIWVKLYSMLVLPHSPLASSRQGRDAGWHQPLHGFRWQDHLVRWAILGPQVLWLYICKIHLRNHWIQALEIRKRIRYDRASEAVIFRESLVIKTCPFWILEAFSRSDQHPHGLGSVLREALHGLLHLLRVHRGGGHLLCKGREYPRRGGDSSASWWHIFDMFIGKMAGNMDQWSWSTGVTIVYSVFG